MGSSFRLFRIFGIDVRVHFSFLFLPLFFAFLYTKDYGLGTGFRAAVLILMVFACVLAHELCHSFQARRFGIAVPEITLYPIGGIARMQRIPREPWQEFWIAIVGPFFNLGLAAFLFFPLYTWLGPENLFAPSLETWPKTFANVFWINPVLGLFNLIPAFPMDGGRLLRSALSLRMSYEKATRISVYWGRLFAILFLLLGVWQRHWMLALVAVFIYLSASDEEKTL
jgi:Zn-dependent protease